MIGTIVVILIVLALLYYLWTNNKLNMNSINESSPSLNDSSGSITVNENGTTTLKFNNAKIKSLRVLHGENKISKIYVAERPLTYTDIVEEGNKSVGTNCVFLGTLQETAQSSSASNRVAANFDIKQFKNMFIVFKNLDSNKIKESVNMARFEADGMVYCLIDSTTTSVPDLRDASYPITVYTTNANVQLKLREWDYTQINDAGTLFIKNEKSFRLQ
ncbi:ODV-E25 [Spodoptera frugiperda multiple nucleopolyhedrovirus]|uniref:ODV-E25 n=1 Tax=Spodoptera frugiperda nuclear polyhedrosis virus TaxID=10455 RepID=A1YJ63_NPVSF|nr:ODV-E25 [Spodoptera frugiperda multiple nucleopolyhedrovirus]ABM45783.1 ODV-E25 [Spodoptera frugiperda multiple nucleopolyhedrovirus]ACA02630.1 ODV-E25 [Spodoptera frugiperda multiple nucleopolyhedrovirus]AIW01484.1 occlusion derived virus E25 protein [Spodoptera frugiperda multiple nucleopolyhedrovirus]QED39986.1 ODV-E25 [Spodoptera frugiperda multiple nucleopolyhedrovirus]QED40131.1 ODV-E25 [Spodoptera frugiperda multiple nucleopolyhedrovirus]